MSKNARDPNRPKVPDLVPLISAVYARPDGGAGCCLHVLFDDGNYDCAEFCLEYAAEHGHKECIACAEMAAKMTVTQLRKANSLWRQQRSGA